MAPRIEQSTHESQGNKNQAPHIPSNKLLTRMNTMPRFMSNSKPLMTQQENLQKIQSKPENPFSSVTPSKGNAVVVSILDTENVSPSKDTFGSSLKNVDDAEVPEEKEVTRMKPKLKSFLWAFVFSSLLGNEIDKRVADKKKTLEKGISKQIQSYHEIVADFIKANCRVSLKSLYKESSSLVIVKEDVNKGRSIKSKDLKARFTIIIVISFL